MLFLDDMQWADAPTLSLLLALMTERYYFDYHICRLSNYLIFCSSMKNLLLICVYRDNEVDNAHLFKFFMDDIEKKSIPTNRYLY